MKTARSAIPAKISSIFVLLSISAAGDSSRVVHVWEPYEIGLAAESEIAEPYVSGLPDLGAPLLRVTFAGQTGEAKGLTYRVTGFWNGGRSWISPRTAAVKDWRSSAGMIAAITKQSK